MSDLYRLVYASKNLLQGSEAENSAAISQILATSQRNNARVDVTGALMFNDGAFAQVLEGPRQGVEATFERIQRDLRHGDVTVLQCAPVESRGFPNWSMAFAGASPRGQTLWNGLATESGFDLSRLNGDEVFATLHGLVLEEEGVSHARLEPTAAKRIEAPSAGTLDVDQVRQELARLTQDLGINQAAAGTATVQGPLRERKAHPSRQEWQSTHEVGQSAQAALAIFRAALASERARTTELRNELDELHAALAEAHVRERALLRERDLWAQRAGILASALNQEAEKVCTATEHAQSKQARRAPSDTMAA